MQTRIAKLLLFALAIAVVAAAAGDLFVGTWKLNVAKSKFSPGPPPKSMTVTIEPGGKCSVQEVTADGKESSWGFTASGDTPATITGMENSTVIEKRTERTVDHAWNMGGTAMTGHGVLSKNGKVMTYTLKGKNEKGEEVHNVEVYDKQ
ncbi:MAG: hypothetical protein ACM336_13220 [Acidobacteriota bacterium]